VAFNVSAAAEAQGRISSDPSLAPHAGKLTCQTTHAAAFASWKAHSGAPLSNPTDEGKIDALVERVCGGAMDKFLACVCASQRGPRTVGPVYARKQCAFFVRKQLTKMFVESNKTVSIGFPLAVWVWSWWVGGGGGRAKGSSGGLGPSEGLGRAAS
jgi:hypothetical protein